MQAACTQQFLEEKEFKYIVLTVKEGFAHYGFSRQVGYAYTSLPKKVDVYTKTIKKDVQQHIRSCRTGGSTCKASATEGDGRWWRYEAQVKMSITKSTLLRELYPLIEFPLILLKPGVLEN